MFVYFCLSAGKAFVTGAALPLKSDAIRPAVSLRGTGRKITLQATATDSAVSDNGTYGVFTLNYETDNVG